MTNNIYALSAVHHNNIVGHLGMSDNNRLPCRVKIEKSDFAELRKLGDKVDSRIYDGSVAGFVFDHHDLFLRTSQEMPILGQGDCAYIVQLFTPEGKVFSPRRDAVLTPEEISQRQLKAAVTKMTVCPIEPKTFTPLRRFITSTYYHSMAIGNPLDPANPELPKSLVYRKMDADYLTAAVFDPTVAGHISDPLTGEVVTRIVKKYVTSNQHLPQLKVGDECLVVQLINPRSGRPFKQWPGEKVTMERLSELKIQLAMSKIQVS